MQIQLDSAQDKYSDLPKNADKRAQVMAEKFYGYLNALGFCSNDIIRISGHMLDCIKESLEPQKTTH